MDIYDKEAIQQLVRSIGLNYNQYELSQYMKERISLAINSNKVIYRPQIVHDEYRLQDHVTHTVSTNTPEPITVPAYHVGFKLFEDKGGMPRSLVHGLPDDRGKRSRVYPLNIWLNAEEGTPGFNCFTNPQDLLDYLPRFKVRAPSLYACRVLLKDPVLPPARSKYALFKKMYINSWDWEQAIAPIDVDHYEGYTEQFILWEREVEARDDLT